MVKEYIIRSINPFGSPALDVTNEEFMAHGFEFGDLLDIEFDNGCVKKNVPFYSGFYVRRGEPVVVSYSQDPYPTICYNYLSFSDIEHIKVGMRVKISLKEKGKYKWINEKKNLYYTNDRNDYEDDYTFANARMISGGKIKKGFLYRACSPFDNHVLRRAYSAKFCEDMGIQTILNLADTKEKLLEYLLDNELPDISCAMINEDRVVCAPLKIDYLSKEYEEGVKNGLVELINKKGPILINCLEGKDRTGFVAALLGALGGMSFDELISDYMLSFDNYYKVNKSTDIENYWMIVEDNLYDILMCIGGFEGLYDEEYRKRLELIDWSKAAKKYLEYIGMTKQEINKLYKMITEE